ncbi:hypothetical protein [Nitrobacter sp. TKz-YC01]|uniref:hypothetical protein n=1 Tax=Nitrobacter sp. TKz-YC01 TaxID=3398703 RepID=UPI003A10307D
MAWIDPHCPNGHRAPPFALIATARQGTNVNGALTTHQTYWQVFASDGEWHEDTKGTMESQHSLLNIERALGAKHRRGSTVVDKIEPEVVAP